jgi:hypothetical protein
MVTEMRIYFEGDDALRQGFREFFRELPLPIGCRVQFIAGGATATADFLDGLKRHPDAFNVLLIDSEEPYTDGLFESVCQRQGVSPRSKDSVSGWCSAWNRGSWRTLR